MKSREQILKSAKEIVNNADPSGTSPHRYSNIKSNGNSIKSTIMSNKKVILGVAAGVAALAVTAIILKRKGYFDGLGEKAEELGSELKDKYRNAKDGARKKIDEIIHKSNEIADRAATEVKSATA